MKTKVYRNGVGPSENEIQISFFEWLTLHEKQFPELALFYAIPNGSHKSPAARGLFKRTGLKPGVPDVHLPIAVNRSGPRINGLYLPGQHYNGLFIEFKAKRGVLSEAQAVWINALKNAGHRVEVCRSWTEAVNIVIEYLNLPIKQFAGNDD